LNQYKDFNMKQFVQRELKRFEEFLNVSAQADQISLDNMNTTWNDINNPPEYVRNNVTLTINVTVDKTEEKAKL